MILQLLRRSVQVLTLLLVFALPMLSLYAHYRTARIVEDPVLMSGQCSATLAQGIHPYVDGLDDPQTFLDSNKGTLWSMRVGGVNWTDPLAALEMTAASKSVYGPLWVSIAIPVALALLLGKVFCSWICPGYLLFEIGGKLRALLRFAEIPPGELRFAHRNKYVVLLIGAVVAAVASGPLFALVYPPAVISRAAHAWIFGTTLSGMLALLGLMAAFELLVSPRWWCRTMCPGGALYGLLGWLRPVRVRLRADLCTGCRDCIPVCEEGINPITQSSSIECDNCGVCIRHCPTQALYYTIGLPSPRPGQKSTRLGAGRAKVAAIGVAAALLLGVDSARAHHILGLPHYSYKENYPQRPTLEYPAATGPYDVLLTSFPGVPVPGETANLALYIKDRETRQVYSQPISVRILQTSTFGENVLVIPPSERTAVENQYKLHVAFPTDGEYVVELSMPVEGRIEVIPFVMIAGQPSAAGSLVVAAAAAVVVAAIAVRAAQRKRRRARERSTTSPTRTLQPAV
ncbi:MAG: 4Fe-4S binding protein [Planctomycetota bacterium]